MANSGGVLKVMVIAGLSRLPGQRRCSSVQCSTRGRPAPGPPPDARIPTTDVTTSHTPARARILLVPVYPNFVSESALRAIGPPSALEINTRGRAVPVRPSPAAETPIGQMARARQHHHIEGSAAFHRAAASPVVPTRRRRHPHRA